MEITILSRHYVFHAVDVFPLPPPDSALHHVVLSGIVIEKRLFSCSVMSPMKKTVTGLSPFRN